MYQHTLQLWYAQSYVIQLGIQLTWPRTLPNFQISGAQYGDHIETYQVLALLLCLYSYTGRICFEAIAINIISLKKASEAQQQYTPAIKWYTLNLRCRLKTHYIPSARFWTQIVIRTIAKKWGSEVPCRSLCLDPWRLRANFNRRL